MTNEKILDRFKRDEEFKNSLVNVILKNVNSLNLTESNIQRIKNFEVKLNKLNLELENLKNTSKEIMAIDSVSRRIDIVKNTIISILNKNFNSGGKNA